MSKSEPTGVDKAHNPDSEPEELPHHQIDDIEDHRLSIVRRASASQSAEIDRQGNVSVTDPTDVRFGGVDSVTCSCGKTFRSIDAGSRHLRSVYRKSAIFAWAASPDLDPLDFSEEVTSGIGTYVETPTKVAARVVEGTEYYIRTAREKYEVPPNYEFEDWNPLALPDGRLTNPHTETRQFSPTLLARALREIVIDRRDYDPDLYRLHYRGQRPCLITGPADAVLVAPRIAG